MSKEYIATFVTSRQIGPDDWDVYNPTLKVTESTTIKQINEFFEKHCGYSTMEVSLREIEQLTTTEP